MNNYPTGAANDQDAPYNQTEPRYTLWHKADNKFHICKACETIALTNEQDLCQNCFEPEEIELD